MSLQSLAVTESSVNRVQDASLSCWGVFDYGKSDYGKSDYGLSDYGIR